MASNESGAITNVPSAAYPLQPANPLASAKIYISSALGRAWVWIKKHPSWTPLVSTVTGVVSATLYLLIASVSLVAAALGIAGAVVTAFIPPSSLAKDLSAQTVIWVSAADMFLATSLRLAVRGVVSAVPFLGNGILYVADAYNGKNQEREHLFCLLDETKQTEARLKTE